MSRIAMFGGSFNPVHFGHTGIVSRMIEEYNLDKVYVVPTYNTPLKDNTPMLSPVHRYNMCTLAFSSVDKSIVSDIEIIRQGRSFTVDTLKELILQNPESEMHLIIGADSFMQLELWYDVKTIFELATILTVSRGEYSADELYEKRKFYEEKFQARVHITEEPILAVSSTQVRNLIKDGKDFTHLLPKAVSDYIITNGLYGYEQKD
ncbi:MAG: nicotinate (nicotinamide) nucleotide adenylyltransferase [Ruminococcus sp.]|nr:nicotinate (nicotinamide) nucleotide adenylyltransferase [Ruminococcus sp.]